ncbi:tRNA binding domain protein [Staphylococcus lugdunensis]|uniref:tRNA binding domain protein n=2 Tax=Staphylococcus lugdunensis TaxID=28035 RepID=A0ABD4EIP1_STALU|nr:tRNA binding domain protein [Staphylococcus lugdunensis]
MMNLFYNPKGVGDVAFLQINPVEGDVAYEIKENVVQLTQDNAVVGFNIFNFSHYFHIQDVGNIKLTEEILNKLQQVISEAGYSYQLDADLSPKFVVGYVKTKEKHSNADKLSILSVDVATEVLQIVCGAPNVEAGQKVVVAKVGAVMPSGMVIKDAQLRGVDSSGMVCSMKELNLPNAPQEKGILVLSDNYQIGQAFFE